MPKTPWQEGLAWLSLGCRDAHSAARGGDVKEQPANCWAAGVSYLAAVNLSANL